VYCFAAFENGTLTKLPKNFPRLLKSGREERSAHRYQKAHVQDKHPRQSEAVMAHMKLAAKSAWAVLAGAVRERVSVLEKQKISTDKRKLDSRA
jgi:hypothetical protein